MSRPSPVDDVLWLLRAGESREVICRRLARRPDSVARVLHRAGYTVEARQFWRDANRGRDLL